MSDLCLKPSKDNLHFNISNYVKAHIGLPVTQLIGKLEVISKKKSVFVNTSLIYVLLYVYLQQKNYKTKYWFAYNIQNKTIY